MSEEAAPRRGRGWSLASAFMLDTIDPNARIESIARLSGGAFLAAGFLALSATFFPGAETLLNTRAIGALGLIAVLMGLGFTLLAHRVTPLLGFACGLLPAPVLIGVGAYYAGRTYMFLAAMLYAITTVFCFVWVRRRWAIVIMGEIALSWGLVVAARDLGTPSFVVWAWTMGIVAALGVCASLLVQEGHRLAQGEAKARAQAEQARVELAQLNERLEERVAKQVQEVEGLNRLRRLLSPQLASAVVQSDELLKPHRRELAVIFADLRGFTNFAAEVEPEEVVAVLEQFYGVVGDVFAKYGATVGHFEGDGVMAFLNDPLPVEDPATKAVEMALAVRAPMGASIDEWRERGFELDYGIGIALGYATVGMVGFEGRRDYTALGRVVNLASRLCDEAAAGEILIDKRAALATARSFRHELLEPLELKGFRQPVSAYRVVPETANVEGATAV